MLEDVSEIESDFADKMEGLLQIIRDAAKTIKEQAEIFGTIHGVNLKECASDILKDSI